MVLRGRGQRGWLLALVCALAWMGSLGAKPVEAATPWPYWQCGHVAASHGVGMVCTAPTPPSPFPGPTAPPPPTEPPPCGQNECCDTGKEGKPVDLFTGREFFTHTDLVLPALVDIVIRRSYDSQAEYDSALGYGWALGYFMRLYEFPDSSVVIRRDCGVKRAFLWSGGMYQTPEGESGTLVKNLDDTWTLWERSWEQKVFDAEGRLWKIVSPQGPYLLFTYDAAGKLPLIGLSPYATAGPSEVALEYQLTRIEAFTASGQATGRYVELTYDGNGRLDKITDSALRLVDYTHDSDGNLTKVQLPENAVLDYVYDDPNDPHNATTIADSSCTSCGGSTFDNDYDSEDRVIRQGHGDHLLEFFYDVPLSNTRVVETTYDELGVEIHSGTTVYEFNTLGNPIRITDALGHVTEYVRDARMNPREMRVLENTGSGLVLVYEEWKEFTPDDQVNLLTEAKGFPEERVTDYAYENGLLRFITRPSVVLPAQDKETEFVYYPATALVWQRRERGFLGDGNPFEYVTTFTYDANGKSDTVDGPRPGTIDLTDYNYDLATGNLTSVTQPGNLVTQYQMYNAQGLAEKVLDPNNVPTDYIYDDAGRVSTVTISGDTTTYAYTPSGKLDLVTFPKLNAMDYAYDEEDRLQSIQDGLGNSIVHTYDSAGNRLREDYKDPLGTVRKTTSFEYDVLHRVKRVVFSDATFWEYGYDGRGNRTSEKDPNDNPATENEYDSLRRLKRVNQKVTSPTQGLHDVVTQYEYDEHDNLIAVIDANSLQTTYIRDDMGRVYKEISPDTGTTTFFYDEAGNTISKTDARMITVGYQYDGLNRILVTDFPTDEDIVYTYDTAAGCTFGKGRLCFVDDQVGTASYAYTAKGELNLEDRFVDAVGQQFQTGYTHDSNGNLDILTYPSGRIVDYGHDLADQITTVTTTPPGGSQQTVASNIEYEPFGALKKLTHGNGLIREVGFDDQYRVGMIKTADLAQSKIVQDLTYTTDFIGNIVEITDNYDMTRSKSFDYDEMSRLVAASGPYGPSGAQADLAWTYDDVGNRLSYTAPEGTTTSTYFAGTNRVEALSGATASNFSYDALGNIENESQKTYAYDENGRLKNASVPGTLSEYRYDAYGQRSVALPSSEPTIFVYTAAGELIAEMRGALTVEYISAPGISLARIDDGDLLWVHSDHIETPRSLTDGNSTAVWSLETRPFGEQVVLTGDYTHNVRFPGQYYDAQTELFQNFRRDYNPRLGRYLEPDPIGLEGGPDLYSYVKNQPINYVDPTGLQRAKPLTRPPIGVPVPLLGPNVHCTAGEWSFVRNGRMDQIQRRWHIEYFIPDTIPLAAPGRDTGGYVPPGAKASGPPSAGGGVQTGGCTCVWIMTSMKEVEVGYSDWKRPVFCDPGCVSFDQTSRVYGENLKSENTPRIGPRHPNRYFSRGKMLGGNCLCEPPTVPGPTN